MVGNMEFYNTVLYMKVNIFICTTNINKTSVCSKNSSNCIVYSENEFSIKYKFKEVLTHFYSKVLQGGPYFAANLYSICLTEHKNMCRCSTDLR